MLMEMVLVLEMRLCTDTTDVSGSVTNSDDADDACTSNEYQDWYVDADGDGFGAGDATSLCTDTTDVMVV